MKFLRKRSTIVLAAIGAAGAIAALATAASFALFYDPPAPVSQTFSTGTVTVAAPSVTNCQFGADSSTNVATAVAPGYSTKGYPDTAIPLTQSNLGDQLGQVCTFSIEYTGSMDAFLATDVSVNSVALGSTDSSPETGSNLACSGNDTVGTCYGLYSPSYGETSDLEIWTTYTVNSDTNAVHALGIGNDQTISAPGSTDVDTTNYSSSTCRQSGPGIGDDCPVTNGFTVNYQVYVYWPLVSSSEQNPYQGSSATVTMNLHAVQAADNPLHHCGGIVDLEGLSLLELSYENPDQPLVGWGSGFDNPNYAETDACPSAGLGYPAKAWTDSSPGYNLYPFSHLDFPSLP
ncbi:MAG: hypothetical protein WA751_07410 [Candidatus Dormiibacterota bacterium]